VELQPVAPVVIRMGVVRGADDLEHGSGPWRGCPLPVHPPLHLSHFGLLARRQGAPWPGAAGFLPILGNLGSPPALDQRTVHPVRADARSTEQPPRLHFNGEEGDLGRLVGWAASRLVRAGRIWSRSWRCLAERSFFGRGIPLYGHV